MTDVVDQSGPEGGEAQAAVRLIERATDGRIGGLTVTLALLTLLPALVLLAWPGATPYSTPANAALAALLGAGYMASFLLIPWRRLPTDAFALHTLAAGLAAVALIARTGGVAGPFGLYIPWLAAFAALRYCLRVALPVGLAVGLAGLAARLDQEGLTPWTALSAGTQLLMLGGIMLSVAFIRARHGSLERRRREVQPDILDLRDKGVALSNRDRELRLLHAITAPGMESASELPRVTGLIAEAFGAAWGCVLVFDGFPGRARVAAMAGAHGPDTLAVAGTPLDIGGGAAADLRVLSFPAIADDARWAPLRRREPFATARAIIAIPLTAGEQVVGLLALGRADTAPWAPPHPPHGALLVGRVLGSSLAAERAQDEAPRLREQATLLPRLEGALEGALYLSDIARRALPVLAATWGLRWALLYVLDGARTHLRLVGSVGLPADEDGPHQHIALDPSALSFEVTRAGRPAFSGMGDRLPATTAERFTLLGARGYAVLPLVARGHVVGMVALLDERERHFDPQEQSLARAAAAAVARAMEAARLYAASERAAIETIEALAGTIEARDGYTGEHCARMAERATALGEALGLNEEDLETLRLGALLHDVGKIGIPDAILNKPARLTPEEYETMKLHPEIGVRILSSVAPLRAVLPLVMHHHERYDGAGYPAGLSGEDIPVGARVLAVVDAYGAMIEDRVYRRSRGRAYALAEIEREAGSHFDPHMARVFLELFGGRAEAPPAVEGAPLAPVRRAIEVDRDAFTRARLDSMERMGSLVRPDVLLPTHATTNDLHDLFESDPARGVVVLGDEGQPQDIVTRQGLLALLSHLYGNALFRSRPAISVAQGAMLLVDVATPPEEAARRATARPAETRYDPLVVTEGGQYRGVVAVAEILDYLNREALRRARLSNPLSGLPGAPLLEAEVSARLAAHRPLALVLADLDGFKAYNDHYGLARGDEVLLQLARQLQALVAEGDPDDFLGHIGGDDFVLLTSPARAEALTGAIRARFNTLAPRLYDQRDLDKQGIDGHNRAGRQQFFGLLTISAVAVDAAAYTNPTYTLLTEQASQLKVLAKRGTHAQATA